MRRIAHFVSVSRTVASDIEAYVVNGEPFFDASNDCKALFSLARISSLGNRSGRITHLGCVDRCRVGYDRDEAHNAGEEVKVSNR